MRLEILYRMHRLSSNLVTFLYVFRHFNQSRNIHVKIRCFLKIIKIPNENGQCSEICVNLRMFVMLINFGAFWGNFPHFLAC